MPCDHEWMHFFLLWSPPYSYPCVFIFSPFLSFQGEPGKDGNQGPQGAVGRQGSRGERGAQGGQGPAGGIVSYLCPFLHGWPGGEWGGVGWEGRERRGRTTRWTRPSRWYCKLSLLHLTSVTKWREWWGWGGGEGGEEVCTPSYKRVVEMPRWRDLGKGRVGWKEWGSWDMMDSQLSLQYEGIVLLPVWGRRGLRVGQGDLINCHLQCEGTVLCQGWIRSWDIGVGWSDHWSDHNSCSATKVGGRENFPVFGGWCLARCT